MAALNDQQRRFVAEYIIDLNGKQAAIRAGYSDKTAEVQASRLLSHVNVREAIDKAQIRREKRTNITADRVLQELADIGFDKEVERTTDRLKALELVGKHLAMFTDKIEMKATITESDVSLIEKVHKRLERD